MAARGDADVVLGLQRAQVLVVTAEEGGLPVQVTVVEQLGADSFVYGTSDVEGVPSTIIVRMSGRHNPQKGETFYVTTDPKDVHVFDTESGERLSD